MIKKSILILVSLFNICLLFARNINAEYIFNTDRSTISYSIELYGDGKYELILNSQFTNDILSITSISSGNYFFKNEKLVLIDNYHKFNMSFLYQEKHLIALKTFYPLLNKQFVYRGSADKDRKQKYVKGIEDLIRKKVLKNRLENRSKYTLFYGTYLAQLVDENAI